ncbi:MAG: PAS domain S-box protein, partial [Phycisphaerales bacterium]|nr:PAS domain S-box protein [Phycisphaerales bacterium]
MTSRATPASPNSLVVKELRWLVRLRWLVGGAVTAVAAIALAATEWSGPYLVALAMGAAILAYNLPIWVVLRRPSERLDRPVLLPVLAWIQIGLDLVCLAAATTLTGGADSPILGFFVLHMVISSLLLAPLSAYLAALLAVGLLAAGLWMTDQWPADRQAALLLAGWGVVLLLTVFLTSQITADLRGRDLALREQHQKLQAVLHTAADGIITIDHRGVILSTNPAADHLFGYEPGSLLGRNVSVLMPDDIRVEHDQYIRNYLETGKAKIIGIGREVVGRARDGREIPLDLSVSEVPLDRGMLFTGFVRDISERKRAQEELENLNRTLQRQQQAMIQNEKMAAMGQMAAGIVHEISNPLASMDSVLQLVQRHPERLNDQTTGVLREQVKRIHRIVRQLTDFAHPNETAWETRDLNEVVAGAMEMMRFDRRLKRVAVDCRLDPSSGAVRVMAYALQQVLVNMVLNALDAMAEVESPQLLVSTRRREDWCVIEIQDNGHGIAAEHLPHVFEPFFTTKPEGKGTGMGLASVYGTVKRHGGFIEVRS